MLYGNIRSKIFHSDRRNDRCRAQAIRDKNLIRFDSLDEALAAGYRKCRHCYKAG